MKVTIKKKKVVTVNTRTGLPYTSSTERHFQFQIPELLY